MIKILLASACALMPVAAIAQVAPSAAPGIATPAVVESMLPAGTLVRFRMDKALATDQRNFAKGEKKPAKDQRRISNKGDKFTMTVLQDVVQGGQVVVPAGTIGNGEVTMVKGRGGFGKSGKIEIAMRSIELNGRTYAMNGTHVQKGKGRGGAAIAGTIIAGAIVGAFIKGEEADIPLGAELAFTTKDAIPYQLVKPSTVAPAAATVAVTTTAPVTTEVAKK